MAIKLVDCWDYLAIGDVTEFWTQIYGGINTTVFGIDAAQGRRGTSAFRVRRVGTDNLVLTYGLSKVLSTVGSTAMMGFAFRASASSSSWGGLITPVSGANSLNGHEANAGINDVGTNILAAFKNGSYTHVAFSINTNGTIAVYRGSANSYASPFTGQDRIAATIGTTSNALLIGQTYFIELKVVIHDSAGSVLIKVNGDTWMNLTGVNTQATGSGTTAWQEVFIAGCRGGSSVNIINWYYDDLWVVDTDSSDVNNTAVDLLGDVRIDYLNVFQDGAMRDWTVLSGLDHFAMVDEKPPDDDTTYNSSTTAGNIDTFIKEAVPVVGATVVAIAPIFSARRTLGGISSTAGVLRISGTNYAGPAIGNTSTYSYQQWIVNKKPSDQSALDSTSVDAMEVGYKKVE